MEMLTTHAGNVTQKVTFSIQEIEAAINLWRKLEQGGLTLGPNVKALADVYGLMIYSGWTNIAISQLSEIQLSALVRSPSN
ncbi:MAG: DUF3717 domain-containing protein [bacterium]|nr:DUF3717 domain-containing protein [bacterium]